jgi:hypothetical protein
MAQKIAFFLIGLGHMFSLLEKRWNVSAKKLQYRFRPNLATPMAGPAAH